MKVFNFNVQGEFVCESIADESPLEPGVFIVPAYSTTESPPDIPAGKRAVFSNNAWVLLDASSEANPIEEQPDETVEQTIARYEAALDAHLDFVARQHRYDNRLTFALRAGYPSVYQSEGIAFGTWMDACNKQSFDLLTSVLSGEAEMPSIEEFIGSLPAFIKPSE